MTPGLTPEAAAAEFLAEHGQALGSGAGELRELWRTTTADGRFSVFAYRQQIRGADVSGSAVRVKVENEPVARVTYAVGRLAHEPSAGMEQPIITGELAKAILEAQQGYGNLVPHGEPERVVLIGNRARPETWAWRIWASDPEVSPSTRVFYINTATGQVTHVQNVFHASDPDPTSGRVKAVGTIMGSLHPNIPWGPNKETSNYVNEHGIPDHLVIANVSPSGPGDPEAYTDESGNYVMMLGNINSSITLTSWFADYLDGRWYSIEDNFMLADAKSTSVGATDADLLLDASANDIKKTAHVDAYLALHRAWSFFDSYVGVSLPNWMSLPIRVRPNIGSYACTAFASTEVSGTTIHPLMIFGSEQTGAGGCFNFASHSVLGHEFGHITLYIIDLDLFADHDALHEGVGDASSLLLNDNSIVGPEHYRDDSHIRNDPTSSGINCQYPITSTCSGTPPPACCCQAHKAGQVLSGVWVRIREGMKSHHGPGAGLERTRQLFGGWLAITAGAIEPFECTSAHPQTLVEVLSLTDALAEHIIICDAFNAHSIDCVDCCP